MIALAILTAWLTLTAAGFAGLSVLRRIGVSEGGDVGVAGAAGPSAPGLTDVRVSIPKALLQ